MTPKISSNMQKALRDPESRKKLDKYFESTERPDTVIEIDGEKFRVVSVRKLAEENKKSNDRH